MVSERSEDLVELYMVTWIKNYIGNASVIERQLWLLLGFGLVLRIMLAPFGIYTWDFALWTQWGDRLVADGFASFYAGSWNDRLPGGILYLLWGVAWLIKAIPWLTAVVAYKLPANIADTVIAFVLFKVLKKDGESRALFVALLYAFNPFTWHISALWGQMDAVQALAIVLAIILLFKGRLGWSVALLVYIVLFKPHSIVVAPLWLVYLWVASANPTDFWRQVRRAVLVGLLSLWLLVVPFATILITRSDPVTLITGPATLLAASWTTAQNMYQFSTVNAFNLWMAFGQNYQSDTMTFLGVQYRFLGIALFGLFGGVLLWHLLKRPARLQDYFLAAALLLLFAFTFLTRAHERHIYPVFALLAFSLYSIKRGVGWYVVLSGVAVVNSWWAWSLGGGAGQIGGFVAAVISLIPVVAAYYLLRQLVDPHRKLWE